MRRGKIFYCVGGPIDWRGVRFPSVLWGLDGQPQTHVLSGDGWSAGDWEIALNDWPTGDEFEDAVRRTFDVLKAYLASRS